MSFWLPVIFAAASAPAFAIGHAVREKRRIDLISGVDPERVADPEGLARFFGNGMYSVGCITAAMGIALALAPRAALLPISVAFVVAANLVVLLIVVGVVRRTRAPRDR